jgi:hypothetical protein
VVEQDHTTDKTVYLELMAAEAADIMEFTTELRELYKPHRLDWAQLALQSTMVDLLVEIIQEVALIIFEAEAEEAQEEMAQTVVRVVGEMVG